MPPCPNLKEYVVHEDINHSFQGFPLPPFLSKDEDVINFSPSQEILFEIFHRKMKVMLDSNLSN